VGSCVGNKTRDMTHLPDEDHHPLLQTDQFLRHPLGLVEERFGSVVVAIQRGLQVVQRLDPGLDQHQHRVEQPFVLRGGGGKQQVTFEYKELNELFAKFKFKQYSKHNVVFTHKADEEQSTTRRDRAAAGVTSPFVSLWEHLCL